MIDTNTAISKLLKQNNVTPKDVDIIQKVEGEEAPKTVWSFKIKTNSKKKQKKISKILKKILKNYNTIL